MNLPPQTEATSLRPAHIIKRRAVVGWVLYDLGNTIFAMGVMSLFFPIWLRGEVGASRADALTGTITAISMGLIFIVSPLLGAMTDRARRRMPFLVVSTLICLFFTALMARGGFYVTAVLYVIANMAYQAGVQFYDAMLPEVSTEANRGRISGIGVGVGYLGSVIAVGLGLVFAEREPSFLFLMVALTFLIFALPCFLFVKERGNPTPTPINVRSMLDSIRETVRTLRSSQEYPGLLRFLIGRIFYTDAINTVNSIMVLYTINVAVSSGMTEAAGETQSKWIMLFAITFAVAGGFFWGRLTDGIGPRRTLNAVLIGWMGIFTLAALVGLVGLPLWCMYVVAGTAGFCLGGVWAADRPFMLRLTPPARIGEFYGLYGMVGRFSAILGPMIWASVTFLVNRILAGDAVVDPVRKAEIARTGQGFGVIVLLLMMGISIWILRKVSDEPRHWQDRNSKAASASSPI